MAKFRVLQSRKPWNKVVEYLYQKAWIIASIPDEYGINSIKEFAEQLKKELAQYAATKGPKTMQIASRIEISIWGDGVGCGICAKGRSWDGMPFSIFLEKSS